MIYREVVGPLGEEKNKYAKREHPELLRSHSRIIIYEETMEGKKMAFST